MNTNYTKIRMTRTGSQIIYKELSYAIIEACIEVHKILGPGYHEKIYEEAVVREFKNRNIAFERQKPINILYKDEPIGEYRLDLVIDDKIILELKTVTDLTSMFEAQFFSYLKATNMRLGILLNFSKKKLEFRRIVN
jgi:GxxExxY protein